MKLLMNILFYVFVFYKGIFDISSTAFAADSLPLCQDKKLVALTKKNIESYLTLSTNNSVREKRRRTLLMKNLDDFREISAENINRESDFLLAGRLVSLKINEGLLDDDYRICQSSGAGEKYKIFLLVYRPLDAPLRVEIINFLPPEKSGEVFGFDFQ